MRTRDLAKWFIWITILVASGQPGARAQQQATLSGTISDSTGGVLPGVTVVATHEDTGNTFEAVTDEGGRYRIPLRTGRYRLGAQLAGFSPIQRTGLELLLGQQAVIDLQLAPASLQESVTVTAEAPLVDVSQTRASGNIDPRQMQDLPVNGRNWQNLALLAPGARANAIADIPSERPSTAVGDFQINIDGQQVKMNIVAGDQFGQPRFSKDAIAEFEFVSNRFDASQGRSAGVQINAITKSGTNTPAGTLSGYFRNDQLIAKDFIANKVLPYSDQQISATFGGPIRKDRIHLFGSYEYEREPQTAVYTSPFARFNVDQTFTRTEKKVEGRLDAQFSSRNRLAIRANDFRFVLPQTNAGGAAQHPTGAHYVNRHSTQSLATLTQVLSNRAVNEVKGGLSSFGWTFHSIVPWAANPRASEGVTTGAPVVTFLGYRFGPVNNIQPQTEGQDLYSLRDDLTYSYTARGRHDVKIGGEYMFLNTWLFSCNNCSGTIDATLGPIPSNVQDLFPVWNDPTSWNLAALSSITRRYSVTVGPVYVNPGRPIFAGWMQDDWSVTRRLTLNLGVRYDLSKGVFGNYEGAQVYAPFLSAKPPDDVNDFAPRLGLAFSVNDKTVLRGGTGKYYQDIGTGISHATQLSYQSANLTVSNDGRADFAANPFNGTIPTFAQSVSQGLVRDLRSIPGAVLHTPYSWQSSIGLQRQLGASAALDADYAYVAARGEQGTANINLTYNPVTGVNYPFTDVARKPYPSWGVVPQYFENGYTNSHAVTTTVTKRMSHGWQGSGTYTWSTLKDASVSPTVPAGITLARDLGSEYSFGVTDQRHRAVFNGIWQMRYGFQLSGLYFYGSGQRFVSTWGGDGRSSGDGRGARLITSGPEAGSIVPRNSLLGSPVHRVDLRLQRRFPLRGRAAVDGMVEVFNAFNHANYGSYVTARSAANYGAPQQNSNVAYQPRMVQLGFRFAF